MRMAIIYPRLVILLAALVLPGWISAAPAVDAENPSLETGLHYFSRGNYLQAAEQFGGVVNDAAGGGDAALQVKASTYLADTLREQAKPLQAIDVLESVRPLAEAHNDAQALASVYGRLGAAYMRTGQLDRADALLRQAVEFAAAAGDEALLAALLNDQGNLLVLNGKLGPAADVFRESISSAQGAGSLQVEVSARNNLARTLLIQGEAAPVGDLLALNQQRAALLPVTLDKAQSLLTIGSLLQRAQAGSPMGAELRTRAFAVLQEGLALAQQLNNPRLESYALGYIGRLYEDEGRIGEALSYTNRAVFIAQGSGAHDSQYLWEWQSARLLRDSGESDKALLAYKQSIHSLQNIRTGLMYSTYGGFRRKVGPVFLEYADLLLRQLDHTSDPSEVQAQLAEVRLTLEQSKVAEVEAYFQDDCVVTDASVANLDQLSAGVAVIYPVLLADRTEVLVSFPDGMRRYTAAVGERELTSVVRQFRAELESPQPGQRFLPHARALYNWLLAPLEAELRRHSVDTLVFVPDGSLRSVPLSALHDGSAFLIERYAVATTPSLTITNPQSIGWDDTKILLNGITEPVQGFSALPSVAQELDSIRTLFPDGLTLKDDTFVVSNVSQEMAEGEYSVVHLATHGQFDSDHRNSFLLAYDGKITMQKLSETIRSRRYQDEPIELLVLSACQTAAGDDRAALGLAGVAIQAGAHSAMASLWFINDEATAELVAQFYKQLKSDDFSRAQALRQAQLSLLQQEYYRHPAYWAPFLLIGNWL